MRGRCLQPWALAAVLLGLGTAAAEGMAPAAEQVAPAGREAASAGGEAAPAGEQSTISLKDGGRLVGIIVREDEDSVTLRTASGLELTLPRADIASIEPGSAADAVAQPAPGDPNDTRLMFAPSGRPLGKGDGYFSNHYVLFPGFAYGLTPNLSIAGGVSTIPSVGLEDQLFYVSTQVGFRPSKNAALSFGGLYAASAGEELGARVLYGVTALGRPERSLTLGFGLGGTRQEESLFDARGRYAGSRKRWRSEPIVIVGGTLQLAKRISLLSESWLFLDKPLSSQPFGIALRFFSGRLSADVGMVLVPEVIEEGFPIPWLSFTYHFGPSRSAAKPRGLGYPAGRESGRSRGR